MINKYRSKSIDESYHRCIRKAYRAMRRAKRPGLPIIRQTKWTNESNRWIDNAVKLNTILIIKYEQKQEVGEA